MNQSLQLFPHKFFPKGLRTGDKIGLIAPAGFVGTEKLTKAYDTISRLGFQPVFGKNASKRYGYLAGTDEERLSDLHEFFEQDEIKAIVCIRGGYGTMRLLPEIRYDIIRSNPKILLGFSDITALLQAVTKETGLITFHGSLAASDFDEYSSSEIIQTLKQPKEARIIGSSPQYEKPRIINPGTVRGELWGGNLSVLVSLMGTSYDIDWSGRIIFLEDVGEAPYRIDRMLTQLSLAGKLSSAAGIIFGKFADCDFDDSDIRPDNSFSLEDVLREKMKNLRIPCVSGFTFGHIATRAIFPVGALVEFSADDSTIRVLSAENNSEI